MDQNLDSVSAENNISLGQQLKKARIALNLSIEDVAIKTNLKKSHIALLEEDIFIFDNLPPTFVRGYVRNYVRFLRLPESLVQSISYGEEKDKKITATKRGISRTSKSDASWLKRATIMVLFLAFSMTLVWWWQEYQTEQSTRNQFVNETNTVVEAELKEEATEPSQFESNVNKSDEQPLNLVLEDIKIATPPDITAQEEVKSEEVKSEDIAVSNEVEKIPLANDDQKSSSSAVILNEKNLSDGIVTGSAKLRIEVNKGNSWIEIFSGNKKLLAKEVKAGEILNFETEEQYDLLLGAPAYVKIYYNDQYVPLKLNGHVERIHLPSIQ